MADDELEQHLRKEILSRLDDFAKWGLKTDGIRKMLDEQGPLATLQHYSMENTSGWWPVIVDHRAPERALEWLTVNTEAADRLDREAVRRAREKLDLVPPRDAV
jgi:hypothetical protein